MASFTLREILSATGGEVLKKQEEKFTGVVTDTRKITPGCLFTALKGERFDGNDFAAQAAAEGAAALIVGRRFSEKELDVMAATVVLVADTLLAYQQLAAFHRCRFCIPIIAITGSNGKTTTKDLTAAILGAHWNVLKTEANYNNEIGLPLTLLQLNARHEAAVVEMGMRGFGQIAALTQIAAPTVGIVTNVGETHMELLGSMENIARAKSELVAAIDEEGAVILNAQNDYVRAMEKKARGKVITFGFEIGDVRASEIVRDGRDTVFRCAFQGRDALIRLPMLGRHNVENALAAISCGLHFGLSFADIQRGLDTFTATKMRLQFQKIGAYTVINDAYNASPASMEAAIAALSDTAEQRKIAVLGDMLELGGIAGEAHVKIGRLLALKGVDAVVTLGALGAVIAAAAQECGVSAVSCNTHAACAAALRALLQPKDTILFKGSRGMRMEKIIEEMECLEEYRR